MDYGHMYSHDLGGMPPAPSPPRYGHGESSKNRRRESHSYGRNRESKKRNKGKQKSSKSGGFSNAFAPPPVLHPPVQPNAFKNDGSFMEMFKKMQQQQVQPDPSPSPSIILEEKPAPPPPLMVGKRRGGRILKTGMVAKQKVTEQQTDKPKDAWSLYMAEVKKYREVCCQEEDNTRPLVK
ncbi:hypothetical protein QAD02_006451 [Eretmocerus hayati]|uniref:Uncharacterized protein n=1 Tax=Eretmocerus hayati TaxID=131215 RepID=A0ACC2N393_9HYME|nr:hypothetical protein QAD02_006451 [Eretmocerus hayati]